MRNRLNFRREMFARMRAAKERKRQQAIADGWLPEPKFLRHGSPQHPDPATQDIAVLFAASL